MAAKKPTTTKKAAKPARKKPAAKAKPQRPPHGKAPPTAAEASDTGPIRPKHQRFVDEYLVDLNATQAAVRAGYSPKTAEQQGPRLLGNAGIARAIEAGMKARAERTGVTAAKVLTELALIGFSDVTNYRVNRRTGELELNPGAPPEAIRAVSSVKHKVRTTTTKDGATETTHDVEIRLWDKNTALANAGRHLGMFLDRVQHSADAELAALLKARRERARASRRAGGN